MYELLINEMITDYALILGVPSESPYTLQCLFFLTDYVLKRDAT